MTRDILRHHLITATNRLRTLEARDNHARAAPVPVMKLHHRSADLGKARPSNRQKRGAGRLRVGIDVMSVDVEGMDLEVLASNDWQRFRPRLVIAELLETQLNTIAQSDIHAFLAVQGYVLVSKLFNSAVFMARNWGANPS